MRAWMILAVLVAFATLDAPAAIPTGKLPAEAAPLHYALHLTLDPRDDRFEGVARIKVRLDQASDHLWLHARELVIDKTSASDAAGKPVEVCVVDHPAEGLLEVRFATPLPAQTIELGFEWNAAFNRKLEGLYKVVVGDDAYALTQMEAISARYAFPGFDEPRFKVPFDVRLTVPMADVAIANTLQTGEEASADGQWKTLTFATTRPLPTYLLAWAVGPWESVEAAPIPANAVRPSPLPLRGFGPRGSKEKLGWALATAAPIVAFFEDYTAQPYPFDKLDLLAAPDFAAGAMENAGLIIYRDAALLADGTSGAEQFRSVFNINAHEIAHQWYGNLVTVPWWDDLWLNEAYATWAQAKVAAVLHREYQSEMAALEGRRYAMSTDSLLSTRRIRQPIENEGDIETAFDAITYQKGAAVLAMFERWVGEETFRDGMRAYLARRAFASGSSDELIATLAEHSGKGDAFATAMRSFLDQPGVPLIQVQVQCDADNSNATLDLAQTRYLPYGMEDSQSPLWAVPVCVRAGRDEAVFSQCVLLERQHQQFAMDGGCPGWIMPNADARGYYRFELDDAGLKQLGAVIGHLAPVEQLIYADALAAAFRRGTLAPQTLLQAMPALAGADAPEVATALTGSYVWIQEHLVDATDRDRLDRWVASLYAPRMQELGWRRQEGESLQVTSLRSRLAVELALFLEDPAARRALAAQGRAALGLDGAGRVDFTRADADLLSAALVVAVQDGGAAAFDAAVKAFEASRNSRHRYALLGALGSAREPELAARARAYGLSDAVQIGELTMLYWAHMDEPANRAATWQWMTDNFDALRQRVPAFARTEVPTMFATGRCDAAAGEVFSAFFTPRIKELPGADRGLRQALERIHQCTALREHLDAKALAAWIEDLPAERGDVAD